MKGRMDMAIKGNIGRKVKDATRTAVKASSDFLEITKINMAIKSDEEKIKDIMFDIGKIVYESYNQGKTVDELSGKCDEISILEKDIEEKKLKVIEIKKLKQCKDCKAEIDEGSAYCPYCGKKVE